jgi:Reverse transcriptase (RNA-dependent DNA polymerase)
MLTNVYGPTDNACKGDFLQELRIIACLHDMPWLIMGDFNILRDPRETTSQNPNLHSMLDLNLLISNLQLQELPLTSRTYTWSNKMPQPSFSKLDRILLSEHWADLSSHIPYLSDLPTTTSDHTPLTLNFKRTDNLTSRSFRFERYWLLSEEARDIVGLSAISIEGTRIPESMDILGQKHTDFNFILISTSHVKVNGIKGGNFYHRCGLRQGDPLSLLLFILATDTIQTIIHRLSELLVSLPTLQTTVLQFADDTTIFTLAHVNNLKIIHYILHIFEEISGLHINFSKSGYYSIAIPNDLLPIIDLTMQCKRFDLRTEYLGLPLSIHKPNIDAYLPLISRVQQRHEGWAGKHLSPAGRAILTYAVLNAMSMHYMQAFLLPSWVTQTITKSKPPLPMARLNEQILRRPLPHTMGSSYPAEKSRGTGHNQLKLAKPSPPNEMVMAS